MMMVAACTHDDQAGRQGRRSIADRLTQRMKSILERYEKLQTWTAEGGLFPYLRWLVKRLARCYLERYERRVAKQGAEGPPERLLNSYVRLQAYLLMAVTGLGYLALTWATVVLLGGFVTSLQNKDFWCLTVISMIQAASIFDTLQDDLVIYLLRSLIWIINCWNRFSILKRSTLSSTLQTRMSVGEFFCTILMMPISMVTEFVVLLYLLAPFVGIILSAWRLQWREYATKSGGDSPANLTPALDMYYALILLQGLFYLIWYFNNMVDEEIVRSVSRQCKLYANWWGKDLVSEYLSNTRRTCAMEPASLGDRDLITYAVELIESKSRKEYMSGARLLTAFIEQGKDVRSLLLLSRPKIQKLIDTLGWRVIPGSGSLEIRPLVAKIVADVAGNIHLAQFPGAAQCIASLFQKDEADELLIPRENRSREEGDQEDEMSMNSIDGMEGDTYNENELILQGLTILERLASNHHNGRDICNTPGLLSVIMAPIYSDTLIQDIEVSAYAQVVYTSFKVVYQLIRTPGWTGRRLRHEISSNKQAVSNLESILYEGTGASQELQMGAMDIHTEMALDLSINLADESKENLIKRQLQIFLAGEGEGNPTAMLRILAGRTLTLVSNKSETNSLYIIMQHDDNADRLTEIMFDGMTNIVYKKTAAEILVNLCTHSMLPEEYVKGTLLPKVLARIVSSSVQPQQPESSQRHISAVTANKRISRIASQGDDVENQLPEHNLRNKEPTQQNEEQIITNELLEALLSLTLLIYDKMIYIDGFIAVFQEQAPADKFVAKLKTIVEENSKATSVSLRIVKLCGQIAISMMQQQYNQYIVHFRHQKFVESLSKASGIMSNLESCLLVTGTNYRMKKNIRPLLSHIEKKVLKLVC